MLRDRLNRQMEIEVFDPHRARSLLEERDSLKARLDESLATVDKIGATKETSVVRAKGGRTVTLSFVTVDAFRAGAEPWVPVGPIASVRAASSTFLLRLADQPLAIQLSILSPTCLRVRFSPRIGWDYGTETSVAVINRDLGHVDARIVESTSERLIVDTGSMRIEVDLQPYALRIYRDTQLICADQPGRNLVYRPGEHGIANIKRMPENAVYCGLGEKAGVRLLKNGSSTSNFNFDNFSYARAPIPAGTEGGPLNPAEPLYASIPLLIEINRAPTGDYAGPPYCYGLFFDNVSQSFFNVGDDAYVDMHGRYAFGALFGELDYYFFLGDGVTNILEQFTSLTGRGPMPPKYAFGFHQGCYGYYDRASLESVARAYREARIPIDGLHIDIDFQDNYRVFTHSEMKFPRAAEMMGDLHARGFKCSTNVTPLVTDNPLDERGEITPFRERQEFLDLAGLLYDVRVGREPQNRLFAATISYGANRGVNPYRYPPLTPNREGVTPLGATINYPDLGRPDVRAAWGRQYAHLIQDLGIDMIWQDMMCPAAAISADTPVGTLPLDLMTFDGRGYVPHAVCHNAYAMFLLQATHEGIRSLRPETRPFILARGGYAGLQRYAALWTGDNASSWDFLRINVPQMLNLGLSGVPISGADVGGFATGPIPGGTTMPSEVRDGRVIGGVTDPELFVRWMQAGSFLPWFRNHYLGYDKDYQEAYAYGEPITSICRRFIELRYRLLQVYYDAMYEWTQTGMPIVRALFLNDPDDPAVYQHLDDQFFVGKDILVAPVLSPAGSGETTAARDVYLPAGSAWFDFCDGGAALGSPIGGRQTLRRVRAGLDQVPVYIREGAILPMRARVEQYVGELKENPLDIHLYPGPDGDHLLYQDDGISTRAEKEEAFRTTRISRRAVPGGISIRLQRLQDRYTPPEPFFLIRLLGTERPRSVSVGGGELPAAASVAALEASPQDCYLWDETLASILVKVFDRAPDVTLTVLLAS
jgi:alpha-glucosidase